LNIKTMLKEVKSQNKLTKSKVIVGVLDDDIVKFLEKEKVPIHTQEIYLTSKGLSHLSRDSKKKRGAGFDDEDILNIPLMISSPKHVYFDKKKEKLNILYLTQKDDKLLKLVVDTNAFDKKYKNITLIKTSGVIDIKNINDKDYIKIK